MFARQLIAAATESLAATDPPTSIADPERALQLYERHNGWGQWKVVFPGSVVLSERAAEVFGLDPADGPKPLETMVNLYHPEDRGKLLTLIAQTLEGRRGFHCRLRVQRPDGGMRVVETIADLQMREFRVTGLIGSSRDVTAELEREALTASRTRMMQDMVAEMPSPVVLLDDRLRVLDCSKFWLKCYRFADKKEAVGRSFYHLFPDTAAELRIEHERALRGETVRTRRTFTNPATGQPLAYHAVISPWQSSEDKVGGIVIMVGWAELAVARPQTVVPDEAADFDGSLLDLLKTVI